MLDESTVWLQSSCAVIYYIAVIEFGLVFGFIYLWIDFVLKKPSGHCKRNALYQYHCSLNILFYYIFPTILNILLLQQWQMIITKASFAVPFYGTIKVFI